MILITTHINADFDGLAAMVAAAKLYPGATLAFPASQERNVRAFIQEHLQHKYTFLKMKEVDTSAVTTLVLVDTRSPQRIGRFASCLDNPGIQVHLYDHHPAAGDEIKGDIEKIEQFGATTTLLVQLLRQKRIAISQAEATLFALGIYEDTGSLSHLSTSPQDLRTCGWLLEQGAELDLIAQFISHELTSEQISILHDVIKTARKYVIQDIPVVIACQSLTHYVDDCSLIVRRYMAMEDINVLFALFSMEGRILLICRSNLAAVNAGDIARDLGGGGHATAASATLKDTTLIEAEELLLHCLHRHIRPQPIADEMLSKPAITIPPDATIREAKALLTRYNITAAIVRSENRKTEATGHGIEGIISRMVVEKASHFDFDNHLVADHMTTDIQILPLNATLADIQDVIIRGRQRLIPIVQNRSLIGVITRTDLLNRLVNDPAHLPKEMSEPSFPTESRTRNLSSMMAEWFDKNTVQLLQTIGEEAAKLSYNAYAVGGFVRDLLLKQANLDLDVVIEGDGIVFARSLANRLGGRYRTHKRFRTAVVILPDGFKIDIATARLEYYEYPAAMPTIELSSIKLDLSRRDFTINAMAIHLGPDQFGTLIDFFNCQNDLKQRVIKVLHNLSFVEDPSRIFRAIRFEQRMDFQIATHTKRLITNAVEMGLFNHADDPRFLTELKIIFEQEDPLPALQRLAELKLFDLIWPPIAHRQRSDRRFLYSLKKAQLAISWYRMLYQDRPCQNWVVYVLTILSTTDAETVKNFCRRFNESRSNTDYLLNQKYLAEGLRYRLERRGTKPANSIIVDECEELEIDGLLYAMATSRQGIIRRAVSSYVTTLQFIQPELTGQDLVTMGHRPGPLFKKILRRLRNGRLDGFLNTREDELALVKREFPVNSNKKPSSG